MSKYYHSGDKDYSDPKYQPSNKMWYDKDKQQHQHKGLDRVDKLANLGYIIARGYIYGKALGWLVKAQFNLIGRMFDKAGDLLLWISKKLK